MEVIMTDKISVLIAEDMEPIRKRYKIILNENPNIEVVGDAGTGSEICKLAKDLAPNVILMDIEMETKDAGIRAIGEILSTMPDIKIIILTIYEEDEMVFSAFRLGACDYILKNASEDVIVNSVILAYNNQSPIRQEIASKIRSEFVRVKTYESDFLRMLNILALLSPKELDTLYLLINGYSRKDVCKMHCVEISTVKTQIGSILKKFNKKSISDIIKKESDVKLLESILINMRN
jgi:DNA-binding NarL/FixJ family response regulator